MIFQNINLMPKIQFVNNDIYYFRIIKNNHTHDDKLNMIENIISYDAT